MESRSGGAGRSRGPARRTRRRPARMATRMRGRGGARRQHRAASGPQARARRGGRNAPSRRRQDERTPCDGAGITVKVRPISGNGGRGRREHAWTPRRPGAKAISRLPSPPGARRNMRFRKSLDRRKSDAPIRHTHDRPRLSHAVSRGANGWGGITRTSGRSAGDGETEKRRKPTCRICTSCEAGIAVPSFVYKGLAMFRAKNWGISNILLQDRASSRWRACGLQAPGCDAPKGPAGRRQA